LVAVPTNAASNIATAAIASAPRRRRSEIVATDLTVPVEVVSIFRQ